MQEGDAEDFGVWLARQLRRKNMNQADFAQQIGLTRAAVSAWITGRARPRAELIPRIAEILGTDVGTVHHRGADTGSARPVSWYHRPAHQDGGREYGNAAAFAFAADAEVVAREATQNSLDERLDPTRPVRVRFTLHELTGEHLQSFLKALRWSDLEAHYEAAAASRQKVGRVVAEGLRSLREDSRLLLLRIDDYNASGLTGPEYGDGRFAAVVRRQLDSHKQNESAGGSYGLGKATLWGASRLGLVLINSTLSQAHEGRTERRVIGRLELPYREVDGQEYAGPAWLGEPDTDPEHADIARSWWADEATVAELRLTRESDEPGTSFLVVGAHDSSGKAGGLQELHSALRDALTDNFWAAMTHGRSSSSYLEASVRSLRNGESVIAEERVDPRERHPALTRALRAHLDGETVTELTAVDQVAVATVDLEVPATRASVKDGRPKALHRAVLLVTPADAADTEHSRIIGMRGTRMTILNRAPRDLGLGVDPFQAVLLAGAATGGEDVSVHAAEAFLRAAEPPAHDRWTATEELTTSYPGAQRRITDFNAAMDAALRGIVGRRSAPREGNGPAVLRDLLRLDFNTSKPARRVEGHPVVDQVRGRIDDQGAWALDVLLKIPQREGRWKFLPVAKFDVRSGSRPRVDWSELVAGENCEVVDGHIFVDPEVRSARFSGVTAIGSHPVSATLAGVLVDIQQVEEALA